MADELGGRLAHVHLADGTGLAYRDEHLVPGRGTQPCAPLLRTLAGQDYRGVIVLEVKTFRAATQEARLADLAEALEFARANLAGAGAAATGSTPAQANGNWPGPAHFTGNRDGSVQVTGGQDGSVRATARQEHPGPAGPTPGGTIPAGQDPVTPYGAVLPATP
jgi:hypothetical protein